VSTPVVLISGGAEVTPLISMLSSLLAHPEREVVFVHRARNSAVHAMKEYVCAAARRHRRLRSIVFYNAPLPEDVAGRDYDYAGVVDLRRIAEVVVRPGADYFLCGPLPFMRLQHQALSALGGAARADPLRGVWAGPLSRAVARGGKPECRCRGRRRGRGERAVCLGRTWRDDCPVGTPTACGQAPADWCSTAVEPLRSHVSLSELAVSLGRQ
jgi:hypothetical protein